MVDDEDFEKLNLRAWSIFPAGKLRYAKRGIRVNKRQRTLFMHQEIMGEPPPEFLIDHKDGNGLNNQKNNLQFATHRQNCQNFHITTSSIYPGVGWHKSNRGWEAYIRTDNRKKYLGCYKTEREAFIAYLQELKSKGERFLVPHGRPKTDTDFMTEMATKIIGERVVL